MKKVIANYLIQHLHNMESIFTPGAELIESLNK